jgi:tetratricopeptide (TPR) repeat protein
MYLLAETYLKLGKLDEARKTIAELGQLSSGDYRTQTGVGVLLARFRLYDDAIQHFKAALRANPDSDDVKFDLTDAYFRRGLYAQALETSQQVSASGQQDDAFLSLLGDIYAHLGDAARAEEIFREAIKRNPDNDQYFLSLTLVELRENNVGAAEETLRKGLARSPSSGKLLWGLGIVFVLEGKTPQAAQNLERASQNWFERARTDLARLERRAIQHLKHWQAQLAGMAFLLYASMALGLLLFLLRGRLSLVVFNLWRRLRVGDAEISAHLATLRYEQMLRMLERRGLRKRPAQTPLEFAAALPAAQLVIPVAKFTDLYLMARFGSTQPDERRMSELLSEIRGTLDSM